MQKVLSGIKVLEQGTFITGPAAGMFLADLGAEVVKLEQPGAGDPFRAGLLDLDHLGAEVREEHARRRAGDERALFEHLDAAEDFLHRGCLLGLLFGVGETVGGALGSGK